MVSGRAERCGPSTTPTWVNRVGARRLRGLREKGCTNASSGEALRLSVKGAALSARLTRAAGRRGCCQC